MKNSENIEREFLFYACFGWNDGRKSDSRIMYSFPVGCKEMPLSIFHEWLSKEHDEFEKQHGERPFIIDFKFIEWKL